MPTYDFRKCGACNREIAWAQTIGGPAVPIDVLPVDGGELVIITGIIQPPLGEILDRIFGAGDRYTSHTRTCPVLNKKGKKP